MSDYPEPSIEETAEEVDAAARALHDKWQQPQTDLVVPPSGNWSKLVAARATYVETPLSRNELWAAFPSRFDAQTYRQEGDMTTATANALEIAYKSGLFGRGGTSIDVLADEVVSGKHHLLIIGTIYGKPDSRTFEIAREGNWNYKGIIAKREAREKAAKAAPPERNLTRDLIIMALIGVATLLGIGAILTKLIVLLIVAVALALIAGVVMFFTKFYSS